MKLNYGRFSTICVIIVYLATEIVLAYVNRKLSFLHYVAPLSSNSLVGFYHDTAPQTGVFS